MRELAPRAPTAGAPRSPRPPRAAGRSPSRPGATRSPPGATTPTIKIPAGIDVELMLEEGARLLERAAAGVPGRPDGRARARRRDALRDDRPAGRRPARGRRRRPTSTRPSPATRCASCVTASDRLPLRVDRERALFGSWYEFFPRSEGAAWTRRRRRRSAAPSAPPRSGCPPSPRWASTSSTCRRSTRSARTNRKGPNNTLTAGPARRRARRGPSARRRAGTTRSTPTSARSRTSTPSWRGPRELGHGGRARLRAAVLAGPPLGARSTPSGSPRAPTARSRTPRTRRRSTRTSTRSTSTATPTASTPRSLRVCGTGWTTACGSSGSTTRTPSRWSSGSG